MLLVDAGHPDVRLHHPGRDLVLGNPGAAEKRDQRATGDSLAVRSLDRRGRLADDIEVPLHEVGADRLLRRAGDRDRVGGVLGVVDRRSEDVPDPYRRDRQREQAEKQLGDGADAVHLVDDAARRFRLGSAAVAAEHSQRHRVEPVGEPLEARAADVRQPARAEEKAGQRMVVGPAARGFRGS